MPFTLISLSNSLTFLSTLNQHTLTNLITTCTPELRSPFRQWLLVALVTLVVHIPILKVRTWESSLNPSLLMSGFCVVRIDSARWGVDSDDLELVILMNSAVVNRLSSFSNFNDYLESIPKLPRIDSYVHRVDFKSFMRVRVDSDTLRIDSYTSRSYKLSVWLHGIDSPRPGIDYGP
ncbi:hypothetical protein PIB30_081693 [Stylosanthes scabra]|uniref:Uncharacterized protein n=1 Tax=Stylosanthes scabra TaxID=79078 RepID=A0ABU6WRG1_9FABA|nr:hypothetical protein [Stylosanthes scabra]